MSEHVDWITSKADCELPKVFQDLEAILRKDVEIANQKSPFAVNGHSFVFQKNPNQYILYRIPPAYSVGMRQDGVEVTLRANDILLEKREGDQPAQKFGTVTRHWNVKTGHCELRLNRDPCVRWQISHAALDPLVF